MNKTFIDTLKLFIAGFFGGCFGVVLSLYLQNPSSHNRLIYWSIIIALFLSSLWLSWMFNHTKKIQGWFKRKTD